MTLPKIPPQFSIERIEPPYLVTYIPRTRAASISQPYTIWERVMGGWQVHSFTDTLERAIERISRIRLSKRGLA